MKKTIYTRIISFVCALTCALTLLLGAFAPQAHASANVPFEGVWEKQPALIPKFEKNEKLYEIVDEYTVVRDAPYETGEIVRHFHAGEYVRGEMITNLRFNKWLRFEDEKGNVLYTYSSHVREHKIHCWSSVIEAPTGRLLACDCGFLSLEFDNNADANITVDGLEYLKQIILGNYSKTHSFTSGFACVLIGLTPAGIITDIRDLSADVYYCAQGDCDLLSLALDFAALLPLLDMLRYADSLRAVKTLDALALAKYGDIKDLGKVTYNANLLIEDTYSGLRGIYAGKSRLLDIEIHHVVEQRFSDLFDVHTDDYLSTPLWTSDHDVITKRWRDAIPYEIDYTEISYEEMVDAVNYVYEDNSVLRKHALEWVSNHWAN